MEGDETSFTCRATGLPAPTLLWKRNGEQIDLGDNRYVIQYGDDGRDVMSTLIVVEVCQDDAGCYDVIATNDAGEASCQAELIGTRLPSLPVTGAVATCMYLSSQQ